MPAMGGFLCPPCNRYFVDKKSRDQHMRHSSRHPTCHTCDRGFIDQGALDNHIANSRVHRDDDMHMDMPMVDYSDDDDEFIPYDPHYEVEDNEFAQYAGDVYESEYDDDPTPPGHYQHAFDFPPITHGHPWVGPDIEDHDDIDEAHWEDPGEYYDSQSDFDEEHHIPIGPGAIMYSYMHDDDNDSVDHRSFAGSSAFEDKVPDAVLQAVGDEQTPTSPAFGNCPICVGPYKGMTATHCGHVFCASCVVSAIEAQTLCPVCRASTRLSGLRRIYL